jgi:hypothetical protein
MASLARSATPSLAPFHDGVAERVRFLVTH